MQRPLAEKPSASSTLVVRWVPNRNWLEIVPFEFPFIRHRQEISNPVAITRTKTRNKYTCNLLAQTDRGESIFRTACCYIIHVCSFRWCLLYWRKDTDRQNSKWRCLSLQPIQRKVERFCILPSSSSSILKCVDSVDGAPRWWSASFPQATLYWSLESDEYDTLWILGIGVGSKGPCRSKSW